MLTHHNGTLVLRKIFSDPKTYETEKKFYQRHRNNSSQLVLPSYRFPFDMIIEYDVIPGNTFQSMVTKGEIGLSDALLHFSRIKRALKKLYRNNRTIIHGDVGTLNLFIGGNHYYLIDFSDSHIYDYRYDLFVLLYSLLLAFHRKPERGLTMSQFNGSPRRICALLDTDTRGLLHLERHFQKMRAKKHPDLYA